MLIVLGNEASGKSSLLDRLAMMPLLPRGDGDLACTRMPILLRLRHADKARLPRLEVHDSTNGSLLRPPVELSLIGGEVDVREQMNQIVMAEHKELNTVSMDKMIVLHVHSPDVPSIDMLDLPGLKAAPGSRDAPDMPKRVKELARMQIERFKDNAVFLLTIEATMKSEMSHGMELITKHDLQSRTIGVFTKCDLLGRIPMQKLPARLQRRGDSTPLEPHGYVAIMTTALEDEDEDGGPSEGKNKRTNIEQLQQLACDELAFFEAEKPLQPLIEQGLVGCNNVSAGSVRAPGAPEHPSFSLLSLFWTRLLAARGQGAQAVHAKPAKDVGAAAALPPKPRGR
jgi:hypothetical protein